MKRNFRGLKRRMLKFFEVLGSRNSEIFKGKVRGSEFPGSPWGNVVNYFLKNPEVKTVVVTGTRNPKLNFEFEGKTFSMLIDSKTSSSRIIEWVEKLIRMYRKKEDIVQEESNPRTTEVVENREPSNKNNINVVAGGSMMLALAAFVGAAVGSVIAGQEEEFRREEFNFLLVDENGDPVDFKEKARKEREKIV